MEAQVSSNAATDLPAMELEGQSQVGFHEQLHAMMARGSLDFDTWTALISEIEKTCPDNIETISLVYDSFLSKFPLCHGYWKKYANHKARLCTVDKMVEIFEQAVQSATYSVDLWVEYCSFSMSAFQDPFDVRRLFKRGLSFVGKDYLCCTLWDKYIEFEYSQQQWSFLPHIFIQTLRFPTKKLHSYYDNLKKFATILEEEMECQNNCSTEVQSEALPAGAVKIPEDEIYRVIKDMQDPSNASLRSKALQKYISIAEQFYHKACQMDGKIHCFETYIRRPFFHVKPIDDGQLSNWHQYLDFIEKQEDFDWAVKLYERCLIPCANYPEFWMRYVEFMETKGGREIANFALERATQVFLKNEPVIHLFNARFKEQIGDAYGARAAFLKCDAESNSYFVENVMKEANMEKRLGNLAAASNVYEKALIMVAERQKLHTVPFLYIHFSRLKYMISGSADAAMNVIIDGIQHVPHCRLLLEELIKFAMAHEGSRHMNVVDSIIANAVAPGTDVTQGLGTKDREDLSCLFLEFVDLWGTNHDVRKAWNRHIKWFPHLLRTTTSYPTSSFQLLKMVMEARNPLAVPDQPAGGLGSDYLIELSVQKQKLLPPENNAIQPDQVLADQSQSKDDDNGAQDNMQQLPLQKVVRSGEDAAGANKLIHDLVHQSGDDTSGTMESTHDFVDQPREDASVPMESTCDLVHQSQGDSSGPIESTHEFEQPAGPIAPIDASQRFCYPINAQQEQEQDHELEKHLKPVSLDSLSLNSQKKECQNFIPMASPEHDVPQEITTSNEKKREGCLNSQANPSTTSPNCFPDADSAKILNESDENESVSPSSSASHQNLTQKQTHPQLEVPPNSGETRYQMNHMITASEGASSGFHVISQDQQHQQQQASLQQQFPTAEMDAQMQVQNSTQGQNQHQAVVAQGNITTDHAWPVQIMPQQSSVSASQSQPSPQPVYSHPQSQFSQYPMQNSEQLGHMQHNQAYNQMLQYLYQQQLMQQHYQQQLLQMQQPYLQQHQLQQQHGQPYQQQPFSQQQQHLQPPPYQQQPYLLYLQQQQQIQQGQQQQIQQDQQQQQYYQWEGQEREQQLQQYYQVEELPHQQYQQGYPVLLQQHQKQQEQGYQQLPQQQQQQQHQQSQQHLQGEEQQQHQEHITSSHNHRRNRSRHHQGRRSTGARGPSESTYPQQQSPQVVTRPHTAAAPIPAVSPHQRQQSPHGILHSLSAGTSGPTLSPHHSSQNQ